MRTGGDSMPEGQRGNMRFDPPTATGRVFTDEGEPYGESAKEWFRSEEGRVAWKLVKRSLEAEEEGMDSQDRLQVRRGFMWSRLRAYGQHDWMRLGGDGIQVFWMFIPNAVRLTDTATTPFDPVTAEGLIFNRGGEPYGGAVKAWIESEGWPVWRVLNSHIKHTEDSSGIVDWGSIRKWDLMGWMEWGNELGEEAYYLFHPHEKVSVHPAGEWRTSAFHWLSGTIQHCLQTGNDPGVQQKQEQQEQHQHQQPHNQQQQQQDIDVAVYVHHQPLGRIVRDGKQIRCRQVQA